MVGVGARQRQQQEEEIVLLVVRGLWRPVRLEGTQQNTGDTGQC